MYHIKEDLRAIKSAELLYDGLTRVMEDKIFQKITIADVTRESTVSRATFYRNFDSIIDILYWKCDRLFNKVLTDFVNKDPDLIENDRLIKEVFTFWFENVEILEILIQEKRTDIIFNSFMSNAPIVLNYIREKTELHIENEYFLAIRISILVGIFQAWISRGKRESAEEVIEILASDYMKTTSSGFIF